jgi:hypothetical protein
LAHFVGTVLAKMSFLNIFAKPKPTAEPAVTDWRAHRRAELLCVLHSLDEKIRQLESAARALRSEHTFVSGDGQIFLRGDSVGERREIDKRWQDCVNQAAAVVRRRSAILVELSNLSAGR